MFLQELVEQHVLYGQVSDAVDSSVGVPDCQVRVHLRHVLSDEAVIDPLDWINILLIAIRDGFEPVEHFAGIVHRFDVLLVAS